MSAPHIFTHVDACAKSFITLTDTLSNSPIYSAQVDPNSIENEFGRFKIWTGNVAAHHKGRRSLEYRLRDADHLKKEIQTVLTDLLSSLVDAIAIVRGERVPWDELSESDSTSDFETHSINEGDIESHNETELKQLYTAFKNTVTRLFRLSIIIREPAPDSHNRSALTADKTWFQDHDIAHVKEKFKPVDYLSERLGRAISARRRYLTYREEHHQRLSKNVEKIGYEEPKTIVTTNSTEATHFDSAEKYTIDDDEISSQTSYAASENTALRVPRLPREARTQEHFECPLCYMIVCINTQAAWKKHVYRDLHPYSCTFEHCTTADRLYDSRHAWWKHELEAHRATWQCIEECNATFHSEEQFSRHTILNHPELAQDGALQLVKQMAVRGANLDERVRCPLCDLGMSLRKVKQHLGRHQEELALFALPINFDQGEDKPHDQEASSISDDDSTLYKESAADEPRLEEYDRRADQVVATAELGLGDNHFSSDLFDKQEQREIQAWARHGECALEKEEENKAKPYTKRSRREAMSQQDIIMRERLLAAERARMAVEGTAAEIRVREEQAALIRVREEQAALFAEQQARSNLIRQQQEQASLLRQAQEHYQDPRGGDHPPMTGHPAAIGRWGSVSAGHGRIPKIETSPIGSKHDSQHRPSTPMTQPNSPGRLPRINTDLASTKLLPRDQPPPAPNQETYNIRTGFPEGKEPPTDARRPRELRRHRRNSLDSMAGQPPSLYEPSDTGSPTGPRAPRYPPTIVHWPPSLHGPKMSNPVDSNEPRSIRAGGPKITDRDAADFRRREARTRARRQQEEADLEMAAKIIEMEEAPHKAALELRGAKARAEERAENAYAQIEKRQFEEREQRRRQREEEERVAYAQYAEESKERRRQREQKEEQRAARDDRNEAEAE